MADLSASDVSLKIIDKTYASRKRMNWVDLTVGNGVKKYPAAGYIPLPADLHLYGLHQRLLSCQVVNGPMDGNIYQVDPENLRLYIFQGAGFTPAGAVAAPAFTGAALGNHHHTENTDATYTQNATTGDASAGTPAGTVSAPAFTGTPVAAGPLAAMGNAALSQINLRLLVMGN